MAGQLVPLRDLDHYDVQMPVLGHDEIAAPGDEAVR
jgi:hypothetical protein